MRLLMGRFGGGAAVGMPVLALTVSADQDSGYNIATAAGALSVPTLVVLTLNPSSRIKQLTTGAFPAGSVLRFMNYGAVYGPGGNGGTPGNNGTNGGAAFILSAASGLASWEMHNGSGYVFGGGGGGKGTTLGGGGGAGDGAGGAAGGGFLNGVHGKVPKWTGAAWSNLSDAGGRGGVSGSATGNDGRDWATSGLTGDGAPGKAIELNGGVAPTWISGNTSDRVKGAVS